ncbi:MAG: cytochrome c oxidase accessory protein CcoG, partial [Magnetospirillum sp.]
MTMISKPPAPTSQPAPVCPANAAYATAQKIHPRKVSGRYRSLKWWAMALLLAYWHLAP